MDIQQWFLFSIVALQNILNCLCLPCFPDILIPFHSKRLVLCRLLCQSQQHYTLRFSCTLQCCPVLTIFGIFFTDYNRCLQKQIWKSAQWESSWRRWPYDEHTRYYEGKRRFLRLSERARSERDWLFLTNLNGRGKQCCWNWEMSYGNWKFDRNPVGVATRTWRMQQTVAAKVTDLPLVERSRTRK